MMLSMLAAELISTRSTHLKRLLCAPKMLSVDGQTDPPLSTPIGATSATCTANAPLNEGMHNFR